MARPRNHYGKWRIRPRDANGKRLSLVYDTFEEAQRRLREIETEVDEVKRGRRSAVEMDHTFGQLCDYWLERRAIRKRSLKDDASIIRRHLRTFFGERALLRSIGVERIDAYCATRGHLNIKTLANHLTLLKTMFNLAVDLAWLHRAPKVNKPRIPLYTQDFSYLRTDDEIERFLRAAADEGEMVHALYATAVYTGMRAGELGGLQWSDVNLDGRLITVQRSFDGPTKAGDVRYVPVLDALLPILRAWRLRHPGTQVFTSRDGTPLIPSGRIYQQALRRTLKAAGFEKRPLPGGLKPYITFHSLRHTFASHWVMKGGDLFKLQKVLGHKNVAMTLRYAHLAPHAFVEDYARFKVVNPGAADVVKVDFAASRG